MLDRNSPGTLLGEAANKGRLEVVENLIEQGADVVIPGRYRNETLIQIKPFTAALREGKASDC